MCVRSNYTAHFVVWNPYTSKEKVLLQMQYCTTCCKTPTTLYYPHYNYCTSVSLTIDFRFQFWQRWSMSLGDLHQRSSLRCLEGREGEFFRTLLDTSHLRFLAPLNAKKVHRGGYLLHCWSYLNFHYIIWTIFINSLNRSCVVEIEIRPIILIDISVHSATPHG